MIKLDFDFVIVAPTRTLQALWPYKLPVAESKLFWLTLISHGAGTPTASGLYSTGSVRTYGREYIRVEKCF